MIEYDMLEKQLVDNSCRFFEEALGEGYDKNKYIRVIKGALNKLYSEGYRVYPMRSMAMRYTDAPGESYSLDEDLKPLSIGSHEIIANARRITTKEDIISADNLCSEWLSELRCKNDILFLYLPLVPANSLSMAFSPSIKGLCSIYTVLHRPIIKLNEAVFDI